MGILCLITFAQIAEASSCGLETCEHCWEREKAYCIQCKNDLYVKTASFGEYCEKGGSSCTNTCSAKTQGQMGIHFTTSNDLKVQARVCIDAGNIIYIYIYIYRMPKRGLQDTSE